MHVDRFVGGDLRKRLVNRFGCTLRLGMLRGGDVRKREALVDRDVGRLLVDQRFFGEFDVGCCWWRRGECGETAIGSSV